ncbi:MAG: ribonuclease P protein component [Halieaceae bacterium]|nr:ribonuclease P protein component [Halieaceae bacterium]
MNDCKHLSSFGRQKRLLTKSDYQHVFSNAPFKAHSQTFLLLAKPGMGGQSRLGLVIAKKHVKTAVGRNRIKRQAREVFRCQKEGALPLDMVLLARSGAGVLNTKSIRHAIGKIIANVQAQASRTVSEYRKSDASVAN